MPSGHKHFHTTDENEDNYYPTGRQKPVKVTKLSQTYLKTNQEQWEEPFSLLVLQPQAEHMQITAEGPNRHSEVCVLHEAS